MSDHIRLHLSNAGETANTGKSLAKTLYSTPLTILLSGDLGAGKTTFLQGLANGLGIAEAVTSPTFALEQRYRTEHDVAFLHLDLYRLAPKQAEELVRSSEHHEGIRCIEWADRLPDIPKEDRIIRIELQEEGAGRALETTFHDLAIPSMEQIAEWRRDVRLPENIVRHCHGVAVVTERLAQMLVQNGVLCRPQTLRIAGELHDLLRFIDFRGGAGHDAPEPSSEDLHIWNHWKETFAGLHHEEACAKFLAQRGYGELATIIAVHGLRLPAPERTTVEQKILFYADKRVILDTPATLAERFRDFNVRYSGGEETEHSKIWQQEAIHVQQELFPDGEPAL